MAVGTGELPDDRVGRFDQQLAAGDKRPVETQIAVRGQEAVEAGPAAQRAVHREEGIVAAEELKVELKPLERHAQGRKVEVFQLLLETGRFEQGQLHRPLSVQHDLALFVVGEIGAPGRVLHRLAVSETIPTLPPLLAVHVVHQLVGGRIIRRHRFAVGVVGVVHPGSGVGLDRVVPQCPSRIPCAAIDEGVHLVVRPLAVERTAATGRQQHRHPQKNQSDRSRRTTAATSCDRDGREASRQVGMDGLGCHKGECCAVTDAT